MSSSFSSSLAAVVLILPTLLASHPAKADTYKITVVGMTQNENFAGIDDKGNFVVNANPVKCGEQIGDPCFEVFDFGQPSFFTTTEPVLNFDDGVPCTVAVSPALGQSTANGMCNNGHEILSILTPVPGIRGVYDGPNLSDVISNQLSFDGGFINANGDAVFISGVTNELIFAQDLTTAATPEPGSLYLLGTGGLAMLGTLRRNRRARVR
jgi:hypothetical protein